MAHQKRRIQFFRMFSGMIFLIASTAYGQEMMGSKMSCPMCGAMGWGGMILGGLLIISVIAALVALTLFLIRRSRSERPSH